MTSKVPNHGGMSSHSGQLWRKTTILKRWKREDMILSFHQTGASRTFRLYRQEHPDSSATLTFERCQIRPGDPAKTKSAKDYLGFEILPEGACYDGDDDKWIPFRCDSLQELRYWMISLGCRGDGLFSNGDPESQPLESWVGKWDVIHPTMMMAQQLSTEEKEQQKTYSLDELPSYEEVMSRSGTFSIEYAMIKHKKEHCGGQPQPPPLPPFLQNRRPVDDSVLPPHGPPIQWPISIGFGAEIRLPDDVQQIWDPNLNRHVFLDHRTQLVSWLDPRPPQLPPPVVRCEEVIIGDNKRGIPKVAPCVDTSDILDRYARSALEKPHGLVVKAQGIRGMDGMHGHQGSNGISGMSGCSGGGYGGNGGNGSRGGDGGRGSDATHATSGTNASDMQVAISGDPSMLQLTGTVSTGVSLGGLEAEHVVFLNARGGDGGQGGSGGRGGHGGQGGSGGMGGRGSDGMSASSPGERGGNGGPGGHGGNGGDGGNGGQGGDGGHAGDSGMGGNIQISSADPRLFILIEIDARHGTRGVGGRGGSGGDAGHGGMGGQGGCGGSGGSGGPSRQDGDRYTPAGSSGMSGSMGISGRSGMSGFRGSDGHNGRDGRTGETGSILWTVVDPSTGGVACQTGVRYELMTTNYQVTSEVNDGIFEPNEKIFINDVTVQNTGGMYCPDGAEVTFKSTQTVKFVPRTYVLPWIEQSNGFHVPEVYTGRIYDVPCPNSPGPYHGKAEVVSRVHMLNRPFDSGFRKVVLDVQYPIQIEKLSTPTQMGRGEESVVRVTLKNISTMPYGDGTESGGFVEVRIRLDRRLLPTPKKELLENQPYMLTFHPAQRDSIYCRVFHIAAKSSLTITLPIYLEGGAELFDRCLVQADVFLRGKLIEYCQEIIRVCPYYIKREPPGDVLFITGPSITRQMFILWQTIFEMLDVSLDFWDVERYNGLSVDATTNRPHVVTWIKRYGGRMIFYPYHDLMQMLGKDIVSHFSEGGSQDSDSSLLLITENKKLSSREKYLIKMTEALTRAQPPIDVGNKFSGTHLIHPKVCACCCCADPAKKFMLQKFRTSVHMANAASITPQFTQYHPSSVRITSDIGSDLDTIQIKAKKITKNHEKKDRTSSYIIYSKEVNYVKRGGLTFDYGRLDLRRVPIQRSANFHLANAEHLLDLGLDDERLTPGATEIPLGSNFGQVLLMIILNLPLHAKTKLLDLKQMKAPRPALTTPFVRYTIQQLVAMSLEEYLFLEVMARPELPSRLELLAQEVQNNGEVYGARDVAPYIYLSVLSLKIEAKKCPSSYRNRVNDLYGQLYSTLKSHGDKGSQKDCRRTAETMCQDKLRVTYKMLLRNDFLLHCHRLTVKDKMYDLSAQIY